MSSAVQGAGVDPNIVLGPLEAALDSSANQITNSVSGVGNLAEGLVNRVLGLVGGVLKAVLSPLGGVAPASKVAQDLQSVTGQLTGNLKKVVDTVQNVTLSIPKGVLSNNAVETILNETVDGVVKCLNTEVAAVQHDTANAANAIQGSGAAGLIQNGNGGGFLGLGLPLPQPDVSRLRNKLIAG